MSSTYLRPFQDFLGFETYDLVLGSYKVTAGPFVPTAPDASESMSHY